MKKMKPPQSWKNTSTHMQAVLHSEWYDIVGTIQDAIINATVDFYRNK